MCHNSCNINRFRRHAASNEVAVGKAAVRGGAHSALANTLILILELTTNTTHKKTFSVSAVFVSREYCESDYSVVFKRPSSWMGKRIKFHLAVIQSLLMLSPEITASKQAFRPRLLLPPQPF